jgi:hypothetical protein
MKTELTASWNNTVGDLHQFFQYSALCLLTNFLAEKQTHVETRGNEGDLRLKNESLSEWRGKF